MAMFWRPSYRHLKIDAPPFTPAALGSPAASPAVGAPQDGAGGGAACARPDRCWCWYLGWVDAGLCPANRPRRGDPTCLDQPDGLPCWSIIARELEEDWRREGFDDPPGKEDARSHVLGLIDSGRTFIGRILSLALRTGLQDGRCDESRG